MSAIDEIRNKIDDLIDNVFVEGYKAGYEKGMKVTNNYLPGFLKWLNGEMVSVGSDQDGKVHILVARRVQEDPQKLIWADAVQEFYMRNEYTEETKTRMMANETPKEGIISSDDSEVSE